MKTSIYIAEGKSQVVLTPETDYEKNTLSCFNDGSNIYIKRGSFYECHGGWLREGNDDESIMLILEVKP